MSISEKIALFFAWKVAGRKEEKNSSKDLDSKMKKKWERKRFRQRSMFFFVLFVIGSLRLTGDGKQGKGI